jgi:hypothetical protein
MEFDLISFLKCKDANLSIDSFDKIPIPFDCKCFKRQKDLIRFPPIFLSRN